MESNKILEMKNINKEYFGNPVLKGINLSINEGEIHALLGENGAGKSTLMNILFGMNVIFSTGGYEGEIKFDGKPVKISSPKEAMDLGIGMVHQEFMLIPGFSVAENIKLNREPTNESVLGKIFGKYLNNIDKNIMGKESEKALDELGMDIDKWMPVKGLPVGHQQFIEIAREIDKKNIKLLIFDEPTAVLTESEADKLLEIMKKLSAKGIAILFITHRLNEVLKVADNITVIRDGENVGTMNSKTATVEKIAQMMVGRKVDIKNREIKEVKTKNEIILNIKNLKVNMPGEIAKNINLEVKKGEILGIGGLAGQGKVAIANGIMGLYEAQGEVTIRDEKFVLNNTKAAINNKLAFVSEDRRGVGLLLDESIEMNIAITAMQMQNKFLEHFLGFSIKDHKKIREWALKMIKDLDIRCTGPEQKVRRLSGGNQQKVCIARALTLEPEILFISEPTRGIDIGAKKIILDLLVKLNKELGMTIIITSSELTELRSISDRIAIIYDGRVEGILKPEDSDVEYGLMMAGEYSSNQKEVI